MWLGSKYRTSVSVFGGLALEAEAVMELVKNSSQVCELYNVIHVIMSKSKSKWSATSVHID